MRRVVVLISIFSFLFASNLEIVNVLCSQATRKRDAYRIEAGDVLEVEVIGEEGLERTLMVMHNGAVSFPLVFLIKSPQAVDEHVAICLDSPPSVSSRNVFDIAELSVVSCEEYFCFKAFVEIVFQPLSFSHMSFVFDILDAAAARFDEIVLSDLDDFYFFSHDFIILLIASY